MDLTDKVVVVTGAARGIGRATAGTLARNGAKVVLADLLEDEGEAAAQELRSAGLDALAHPVDVADPASAERLAAAVLGAAGRIDGLVNNAGLDAPLGEAWTTDEAEWRRIMEVDLNGAWWCSRAVLPAMMEQRSGRIVMISSVSARIGSGHISPAYSTAKAGLIGMTVGLSAQVEPYGIRVNAITPGPTGDTGRPYSPEGREAYLAEHPLGFGGPQPIADGVLYLLGSSGDWVSGAVLNISGGQQRGI
jgi:NAD(P)-dependent dehydrogenase (short-subunit alcohol dehydrogenase family)